MDKKRQEIQDKVTAAGRGPFTGWWAKLLELSPDTLLHVHEMLELAEQDGPLSVRLRHLVWTVADSVVTHLYPRGAGVHARIAIEEGATLPQVIQAFEIATVVSVRGVRLGLPIILEAASQAGVPVHTQRVDPRLRERVIQRYGSWAQWMELVASVSPDALMALIELAPDPLDSEGLDLRSRELLYFAGYCCPAVNDLDGMRHHARAALEAGATPQELIQVLRLADAIGVHSLAEGVIVTADQLGS